MQVLERWCGGCQGETLFEVPPCEDGHGDDCLDLACIDCGAAVMVGVLVTGAAVVLEVRAA